VEHNSYVTRASFNSLNGALIMMLACCNVTRKHVKRTVLAQNVTK